MRAPATLLAALVLAAGSPAPAAGEGWACSASALSLTAEAAACADDERRAGPAHAATAVRAGSVAAAAGVAPLRAGRLRDLALPAPLDVPAALGAVEVPLGGRGLALDRVVADVRPAVLAARALPDVELLRADAVSALAGGTCRDGAPVLSGASSVTGLRVLGRPLPADRAATHAVALLDASALDLGTLDLAPVVLPEVLDTAAARPVVEGALRQVLAGLPDLALPAVVASVDVVPSSQRRSATALTQTTLGVRARVLGTTVLELVAAGAAVAAAPGTCAEPAILRCTVRRLVLSDVSRHGDRVRLTGVADPALEGELVELVTAGDVAARAVVGPGGRFAATAARPARADARFVARIGRERSMALKVTRRMVVEAVRTQASRVVVRGRVVGPFARPMEPVVVQRRLGCDRWRTVAEVLPGAAGGFRAEVVVPLNAGDVVVRTTTRVRRSTRNDRTYPTATLPLVATR